MLMNAWIIMFFFFFSYKRENIRPPESRLLPDNYSLGKNNRTCNKKVEVTKERDKQMGRKEEKKDNEVDGERNDKWQSDRIPHLASLKTQISQCPKAVKST